MRFQRVFVLIAIIIQVNHSMGFLANIANAVGGLAGRGTNSLLKAISPQNVQNVQNFVKQIQGQQLGAPQYKGIAGSVAGGITKLATWVDGLLRGTGTILYSLGGGGGPFNFGGVIPSPNNFNNGLPPQLAGLAQLGGQSAIAGQPSVTANALADGIKPSSRVQPKSPSQMNHSPISSPIHADAMQNMN